MEMLYTYFIKVSVLVMLFYVAYWLLLKKETFFGKNRMFLLLGLVTALVLPLITITKIVWTEPEPIVFNEPGFVPFEEFQTEIISHVTEEKTKINWSYIVAGLYFLGALFFLLKFVLSSLSLYRILHKTPIKKLNGYKIIDSPKVKTPFSFFSYIAFDSSSFSEEELQNIITHEKVHSNQKHSLDILLSELFLIAFWFNPFVWLYKKAMVQNLEFIADSCAINQSENRINYQKTLLKITLNPESLALANPFYQPLIKKRIMMLNKIKSKKSQLWKYLVVAPLLVLFVMQFQTKVVAQTKENKTFKPTTNQEQVPVSKDTTVWVKDFAKNPNEWINQSTEEKIVVKGGSWEDVKEHLNVSSKKKPLYIINGEEISKEKTNGLWNLEGKVTVIEYDKKEAVEKFGEKGKDGVIVIEGKIESITFDLRETDLITFLKSAKDFKEIEIFNRWGALVYNLKPNEKIDEEKIKSLPSGTYFYQIKKDNEKPQTGYVFTEETSQNTKLANSLSDFIKQIDENEYVEIYDRWGTIVYKPLLNEKFSRSQLSELPVGTYFYIQKDKTGYFYISEKDSKVTLNTNDEKRARGKEIEQKLKSKFRENYLKEKEEFLRKKEQELKEKERQAQENSTLSEEEKYERMKEREKKIEEGLKQNPFEIGSYKVNTPNDVKNDLLNNKDVDYKKALIIINDKEVSAKELENLKANKIRSAFDMKGSGALVNQYGEKAINGVIVIETQDYKVEEYKKELEEIRKTTRDKDYKLLNSDNDGFIIHKTSKESDFEFYKSELKKIGIEMKVSNIKRNKNGEITKIKISLIENSETSSNKRKAKSEATFERESESIPEIFLGKRNGILTVSSSISKN